jgi:hypothetical protein
MREPPPSISPRVLLQQANDSARDEFDEQGVTVMDASTPGKLSGIEEAAPGKQVCPSCGVTVLPGYPKCPRCKATLRSNDKRHRQGAGGTSVVGRTVPWTIVGIAAIATATIVYLADRTPAGGEIAEDEAPLGTSEPTLATGGPRTAASPDEEPVTDDRPDEDTLVDELTGAMERQHLEASVELAGLDLLVHSRFCEDPAMVSLLRDASSDLFLAGVDVVVCQDRDQTPVLVLKSDE